jgi:hypothetical protein
MTTTHPLDEEVSHRFRSFMNRTVGPGYVVLGQRCWRVGGILITQWSEIVKVYYCGGKQTHWFYAGSERLRKAIHRLKNQPQPKTP